MNFGLRIDLADCPSTKRRPGAAVVDATVVIRFV
jgi:hypothetical protein